ncbi:A/G-specific adenine glycosylase [Candidatus Saccharibacteria bacterium]|nr:A/G-specific adenine glycosylase [Candidatus Saccharibacteria bacterium]
MSTQEFQEIVWQHYHENRRDMPWRDNIDPYYILVSEIMLQQTQVDRVKPKFAAFIAQFPDILSLANTKLYDVLRLWSGLGYNRRAKFLWQAAQKIEADFNGKMPATLEELIALPGVGKNTAGAILAYAFNQPVVFIETNIRTVYFHHFFADSAETVNDVELSELVEATLDKENPREWYWALMDYGVFLKRQYGGRLSQSRHYKKQTPLKGSLREMRGNILKALVGGGLSNNELRQKVLADERFEPALKSLEQEGLITIEGNKVSLAS